MSILAIENAYTEFTHFADSNPITVREFIFNNPNIITESTIICEYENSTSIVPTDVFSLPLFMLFLEQTEHKNWEYED
jgi:RecB family endonuclease NucS